MSLIVDVLERIKTTYCSLKGHQTVYQFNEIDKVYLLCSNCGWTSSGWAVDRKWLKFVKPRGKD